jgi:hypothetical protein
MLQRTGLRRLQVGVPWHQTGRSPFARSTSTAIQLLQMATKPRNRLAHHSSHVGAIWSLRTTASVKLATNCADQFVSLRSMAVWTSSSPFDQCKRSLRPPPRLPGPPRDEFLYGWPRPFRQQTCPKPGARNTPGCRERRLPTTGWSKPTEALHCSIMRVRFAGENAHPDNFFAQQITPSVLFLWSPCCERDGFKAYHTS